LSFPLPEYRGHKWKGILGDLHRYVHLETQKADEEIRSPEDYILNVDNQSTAFNSVNLTNNNGFEIIP
jgi:hypothetical protein